MTKVFNIATDNQNMKTTVLINAELSSWHRNLTDGFLASRHLTDDIYMTLSPSNDGTVSKIKDVYRQLKAGDLLIVAEVGLLGNTFSSILRELVHLFEAGIGIGIAEADVLFDARGAKGREYARIMAFVAELFKMMNSRKTSSALRAAKQQGKRLGRPSSLGRLDGREGEISEYLNKRVSKSAIARILGISRASLVQFIAIRQLAQKDSPAGGTSYEA